MRWMMWRVISAGPYRGMVVGHEEGVVVATAAEGARCCAVRLRHARVHEVLRQNVLQKRHALGFQRGPRGADTDVAHVGVKRLQRGLVCRVARGQDGRRHCLPGGLYACGSDDQKQVRGAHWCHRRQRRHSRLPRFKKMVIAVEQPKHTRAVTRTTTNVHNYRLAMLEAKTPASAYKGRPSTDSDDAPPSTGGGDGDGGGSTGGAGAGAGPSSTVPMSAGAASHVKGPGPLTRHIDTIDKAGPHTASPCSRGSRETPPETTQGILSSFCSQNLKMFI